jgi:VWFA-related protein
MKMFARLCRFILVLTAIAAASFPAFAQTPQSSAPDLVRVTVTAVGRNDAAPPPVAKEDVIVRQDKTPRPVVEWRSASDSQSGLDLAILVDDSLDASLGLQLADMTNFVRSLPPATQVAIAYSGYGSARLSQGFTADRDLAAKALRLPLGASQEGSSIFQAVSDLVKNWPASRNRRSILLISDGIDLFQGIADSSPGLNQDLQAAIDAAQRDGIPVYTLFASGAARFTGNPFLVTNGQGCLGRLALETGGESFFQGFQTPISFAPYLQQLAKLLGQQYLLTFRAKLGKKGESARLHVTTELSGVDLEAPSRVFIPAAQ